VLLDQGCSKDLGSNLVGASRHGGGGAGTDVHGPARLHARGFEMFVLQPADEFGERRVDQVRLIVGLQDGSEAEHDAPSVISGCRPSAGRI
jgi:hypothetical protein